MLRFSPLLLNWLPPPTLKASHTPLASPTTFEGPRRAPATIPPRQRKPLCDGGGHRVAVVGVGDTTSWGSGCGGAAGSLRQVVGLMEHLVMITEVSGRVV